MVMRMEGFKINPENMCINCGPDQKTNFKINFQKQPPNYNSVA